MKTHHNAALVGKAAAFGLLAATGWLALAGQSNAASPHQATPCEIQLARDGKALQPVVVGEKATERVRAAAAELAEYLGRISGAKFQLASGDGARGIAVGLPADFPGLRFQPDFHPDQPTGREDYLLRTHPQGAYLLGATEAAVEHAVWDFLYRLGYRQFFPGEHWEVIPKASQLAAAMDTLQRPDFNSRRLPAAVSRGRDAFGDGEAYAAWMQRNRLADGWKIASTHIYGFITRARKKEFEEHPEYLALVEGKRQGDKCCIANPGLRKLVVDYALEHFQQNPDANSISMEPSDGGGWCECPECAKLGSVSTRVVTLANEVAEAMGKVYPGKLVGILAYNFHTAPPEIRVHPQVMVCICAGQLTGNWEPQELFDAWSAKGANAAGRGYGVFEYYSNIVGNYYLPGGTRASNLFYLKTTIADFHRRGARRLSSGIAYSNGMVSLGTYMAARMLWDVKEADRIQQLYQDFLEKAFGPARQPMDRFFRLVYHIDENDRRMPLTEDTVGRMFRALSEAWPLAADADIRQRVVDLVLYTRYVELYLAYRAAPSQNRVDAYGEALRHAWRMRREMMVDVNGLFAYLPTDIPDGKGAWKVSVDKQSWKSGKPFTQEEIAAMLAAGVANNRVGEYQTRDFTANLAPAFGPLRLSDRPLGDRGFGLPPGGKQRFYTWVEKAPGEVKLLVTGGLIWPKRAGNVRITLFSDKAASDKADFVVATDASVPPDQQEHLVVLRTPHAGLHRIELDGGHGSTKVLPGAEGMAFTVQAGPTECFNNRFLWEGWFYVPKGTRAVSFHVAQPIGEILDGNGKAVFSFRGPVSSDKGKVPAATAGGYYTISVPAGQDGRLWKLDRVGGPWLLLNVPPYLARRPSELLLPREVVEADK